MQHVRKGRSERARAARMYLLVVPVMVVLVLSVAFVPHLLQPPPNTRDLLSLSDHVVTLRTLPGTVVRMPVLGFGTAALSDPQASLRCALDAGFKLLDTAAEHAVWYRNEKAVGELLSTHPSAGAVFVTTKLHPEDHGSEAAAAAIDQSLSNLGGHIDLLLIHAPRCHPGFCEKEPHGTWEESWLVMEQYARKGLISAIGVSNFGVGELEQLLELATVPVSVVQNWFDPFHQDRAVRALCAEHRIHYQAYSTLGTQWWAKGFKKANPVLTDHSLVTWAGQRGVSVAQLVLRWALQEGVSVVPRSNSCEHIEQNAGVLSLAAMHLSTQEVHGIRAMDGRYDSKLR
eukprot:TRINITY_DN6285_c0_g1_i1.p1 TRINITY_DN6285_c0_g1~~TRINITY_DN6285_c0_g1_i1.p1  ORF type:complete len:344 (-),score=90.67 TRINITY_DN6285_c0_g1_i1:268-1299(-)